MKEKIKKITHNSFIRNVSTLAAGTVISQLVVIGSAPLLSRLFTTTDFGNLSVFTSITIFFAVLSTGRYEFAIGLPESDEKSKKVFALLIALATAITVIYLITVFVLRDIVHFPDKSGFLKPWTSYLGPFYIFLIAIYTGFGYWFQRSKDYKKITIANALQVIVASVISIVLGLLQYQDGLIIALLCGVFSALLYLFKKSNLKVSELLPAKEDIKKTALEYISFPKYMIVSDLSLTASQQFIPVLFSSLFSTGVVGLYSMANRMIRLPNIIITSAIGNVFRNDAIEEIRLHGNCEQLFRSTFKKLVLLSVPIYAVVFVLSPFLFSWFLGKQWAGAGTFARILSVMLLFEFVSSPLSSVFNIREKQKFLAKFQMAGAVSGALAVYLGYYFFNDSAISLMFFVASSVTFNLILLYFSYKFAKYV